MALPRIVYNAINLDFPENVGLLRPERIQGGPRNTSHGGLTETVRLSVWDEIEIVMENHGSASFHRGLQAWMAWALRGKQWSFAFDSSKVVNTTVNATAAAGAMSMDIASGTGVTNGEFYLVRSADLTKEEIVKKVSGGTTIVIERGNDPAAGLVYGYAVGDTFRDPNYWPKLVLLDDRTPFQENQALTYSLRIRAREDRA